jgi:hypothetical protein
MTYNTGGRVGNLEIRLGDGCVFPTTTTVRLIGVPICPDLLTIDKIGEADTWRGALIRGFFTVLSWVDR